MVKALPEWSNSHYDGLDSYRERNWVHKDGHCHPYREVGYENGKDGHHEGWEGHHNGQD